MSAELAASFRRKAATLDAYARETLTEGRTAAALLRRIAAEEAARAWREAADALEAELLDDVMPCGCSSGSCYCDSELEPSTAPEELAEGEGPRRLLPWFLGGGLGRVW